MIETIGFPVILIGDGIMETKAINQKQKEIYAQWEQSSMDRFCKNYSSLIDRLQERESISILDIGGATGYFANALAVLLSDKSKVSVCVVDAVKYEPWENLTNKVQFIQADALTLKHLFEKETFDCIFANRIFHHLVSHSWVESVKNMHALCEQVYDLLKQDGYFAVTDHYYEGIIWDEITSKLLYQYTSHNKRMIQKLLYQMGAKSAGTGVCMLSEKMWHTMLESTGFLIENELASPGVWRNLEWYKAFGLLNKRYSLDNVMVCTKKQHEPGRDCI